jgi:hypothetical protein
MLFFSVSKFFVHVTRNRSGVKSVLSEFGPWN